MKKFYLFISALLVCMATGANAQSTPKVTYDVPSFGDIYIVNQSDQSLKILPKEDWEERTHQSGWPAAHLTGSVKAKGAKSDFRIKTGDKTIFVFKGSNPDEVSIYTAKVEHKSREADYAELHRTMTGFNKKVIPGLQVLLNDAGTNTFTMIPANPLPAGEYLLYIGQKVFSIGVD